MSKLTLTERAIKEINVIAKDQDLDMNGDVYLRMGVKGGGCSGYQYTLDITEEKTDKDEIFDCGGIKVICDPVSLIYMEGTVVDFKDSIMGRGFTFDNPSSTGQCGCGSSFSV